MLFHNNNYKKIKVQGYGSTELVSWKNFIAPKTQYIQFDLSMQNTSYQVFIRSELPNVTEKSVGLLVEIEGVPAAIWLSSWPLIERIRHYITENKLKKLPLELRAELLETALEPLLSSIVASLGIKIKVLNFLKIKPNDINDFSIVFRVTENKSRKIDAILVMNKKLQPVMESLLHRWPSFHYQQEWRQHVTLLFLEVGSTELMLSELYQLEVADVVLFESTENIKNHEVSLRLVSNVSFSARLDNEVITVISGVRKMSDEDRDDNVANIGDLPVKLTFDIGELVVSFSEVEKLTSGYVINLDEPFNEIVKIRSQNRVIGTGELVDIGGKVGVRIISLFGINTNG
ncbi:MAG: FliM/FliN family flagellar motor switch protein [Cocleimonas sp.]|nr:FliM/FliN family flagellar motor switch protein [Cocleimonas sp.]